MSSSRYWTLEKDKLLIEMVKNEPGIYNVESPKYRDTFFRRKVWSDIEKTLKISEAKSRWEQLRAQYRKYLHKVKINSEGPDKRFVKWRLSEQMKFLKDYIEDKRGSPILRDNSDESNQESDSIDIKNYDSIEIKNSDSIDIKSCLSEEEAVGEIEILHFSPQSTPIPKKKRKKFNIPEENTSSTFTKHILQEKGQTIHPIDQFFSLMAATTKTFSDIDQLYIKRKIFALVTEVEESYLTTLISDRSNHYSNNMKNPLSEEEAEDEIEVLHSTSTKKAK